MKRIEPTIGSLDADPVAERQAQVSAKSHRTRRAMREWFITISIYAVLVIGCAFVALRAGLIPEQFKLGAPQLFPRTLIIMGLLIAFLAQIIGTGLLFRRSFLQGGLSLFVPGYIFFALRRNALYAPVIGMMAVGLLAILVGTILLT